MRIKAIEEEKALIKKEQDQSKKVVEKEIATVEVNEEQDENDVINLIGADDSDDEVHK